MNAYLPLESSFDFNVKRIDIRNKIVELSRKSFLKNRHIQFDYGETIEVEVIEIEKNRAIFYENDFEGSITENFQNLIPHQKVEIYLLDSGGNYGV
jgi:hypothetical protein